MFSTPKMVCIRKLKKDNSLTFYFIKIFNFIYINYYSIKIGKIAESYL